MTWTSEEVRTDQTALARSLRRPARSVRPHHPGLPRIGWPAMTALRIGADRSRIQALLAKAPIIDGHNDLPWELRGRSRYDLTDLDICDRSDRSTGLHTDIPRLRAGGVGAQFWSVYVPCGLAGEASRRRHPRTDRLRTPVRGSLSERTSWSPVPPTRLRQRRVRGPDRVAHWRRGRPFDRQFPWHAADVGRAGHALPDATHTANTPWADSATDEPAWAAFRLRPRGRTGMQPPRRHGRPVPRRARDDARDA